MPPRRNKEKFQQLMEFERGRIIGHQEGEFSYHEIGTCEQRNSFTVMRVWEQWIDEHRTSKKTGRGRWKVTISPTAKPRRLRLQWAHEHRAWQADWHQVVFSDESRFNLWDDDGDIRVRYYAGKRYLPECVIE
ncbi:transposable element Tc1 transposase [Trichonephila clavipes]|nr:transposable element Tc1 transposase [Trichonephila clavipes]